MKRDFKTLLACTRKLEPSWVPPTRLLAIDPGETIGWALFIEGELDSCGHLEPTPEYRYSTIRDLIDTERPTKVVCEDYRVYGHKLEAHTWSDLVTPKLIGAIAMYCDYRMIPIHYQMASTAKGFFSTQKLKDLGMWREAQKHAMDAVRHGGYYLLFNNRRIHNDTSTDTTT